ncbi:TetR family transcriptional regulator [Spongiactinospora gelatinilytica]|uniref:TetR family transcriptional regulator n=1 Tax=Spongiactinospora gelatinilytica TaxID=2666298 RepID=A0A2W2H665_9ACTN|nr:TetR/AcrR family transcriptional regulator [Spongiactinospora gelatinilytica]PZG50339.1 TetR family transcriptional regulator [Spongiactinospora gelatinilytica]
MSQRDDLLAGARRCLADKGYARTTARDIAAASGAHLASIGYHFGSKDNLMNAAIMEATGEWGDTIEAAVEAASETEPTRRFEVWLDHLLAAIPGERDLLVASIQAFAQAQFDERMRTALAEGGGTARESFAAVLLGLPRDQVGPEERESVGAAAQALILGLIVQSLIDPGAVPGSKALIAGLRGLTTSPDP